MTETSDDLSELLTRLSNKLDESIADIADAYGVAPEVLEAHVSSYLAGETNVEPLPKPDPVKLATVRARFSHGLPRTYEVRPAGGNPE